jgi:hypothetical protein
MTTKEKNPLVSSEIGVMVHQNTKDGEILPLHLWPDAYLLNLKEMVRQALDDHKEDREGYRNFWV